MKIFISWSGLRSKAVAEVLRDWIKAVIQATDPFISTRDIDRGATWFAAISDELGKSSIGIVCLTPENKDEPWILFEAGALAKGLSTARVCTLLIDLATADITDPLAQFNHTIPDSDGMWKLVKTINGRLPEKALDEVLLKEIFETNWPRFQAKYKAALAANPAGQKPEQRDTQDLLVEILENTRSIRSHLGKGDSGHWSSLLQFDPSPVSHNLTWPRKDVYAYIIGSAKEGLSKELATKRASLLFDIPIRQAIKVWDWVQHHGPIEGEGEGNSANDQGPLGG